MVLIHLANKLRAQMALLFLLSSEVSRRTKLTMIILIQKNNNKCSPRRRPIAKPQKIYFS